MDAQIPEALGGVGGQAVYIGGYCACRTALKRLSLCLGPVVHSVTLDHSAVCQNSPAAIVQGVGSTAGRRAVLLCVAHSARAVSPAFVLWPTLRRTT